VAVLKRDGELCQFVACMQSTLHEREHFLCTTVTISLLHCATHPACSIHGMKIKNGQESLKQLHVLATEVVHGRIA
jgi:hypothetical protein